MELIANSIRSQTSTALKRCQTCGRVLEKNHRKYCSPLCREQFVFKLNWFNNLLRAISARYAAFSFTDDFLVLSVLPRDSDRVRTYFHKRTPGQKPAQDMKRMVFDLGQLWWEQKEQGNSRRQASQKILDQGQTEIVSKDRVTPVKKVHFVNISRQMVILEIGKPELCDQNCGEEFIKTAFRRAARKHHPDMGGDAQMFKKVYQAYHDLLNWLHNPRYRIRQGLPGQWCYLAQNNTWLKPL